jgi:phosphate-selective porin OprO/OprP
MLAFYSTVLGEIDMSSARHWCSGIALTLGTVVAAPHGVAQQIAPDSVRPSLAARVDALDQQIRVLRRLRELAADSAATAASESASVTANAKEGFSLKSADGKYGLRLRGYAQTDARFVPGDEAGAFTNSFLLRRARPILEATVGRYFDFRLMPDFGQGQTVLFDAYWEGKFDPAFTVRAGKFKSPISLERLRSATDVTFAERGFPSNLAPNRDIGLQIAGDISGGVLSYQAGVFDGAADLGNLDADLSDSKDLVARLFVQPFGRGTLQGSGFGIAGSTGNEQGSATATGLPGYRTPSQQTFFRYRTSTTPGSTVLAAGRRSRLYPQAFLALGSLGVLGEYAVSRQDITLAGTTARLEHHAWQASGSYFLTGEKAGFRSPAPRKPFDLKAGTFGALELAARYGEIDIDDDAFPLFADPAGSAREARGVGLGVNWYLNKAIKLLVNYEHTTFAGGATSGDRKPEDFVVTRFQHSF